MRRLDIGVVGGGTAGCAAALLLSRAGHEVTVYERVADPRAVGAGILLQPTGQHVLARLGLLEEVLARTAPLEQLRARIGRGRTLFQLRYADLDPALRGEGLHRGVLHSSLLAAVRASSAKLRCGVSVEDLSRQGEKLVFLSPSREELGAHELCVVADGARSRLRDDTEVRKDVREYPWGALWFVAKEPALGTRRELFQVVRGAKRLLGLLPTGKGPEGDVPLVSLFDSLRGDRYEAFRSEPLERWKQGVLEWMPEAEPVLAQVRSHEDLVFTRYLDVRLDRWHSRGVVYLGDAAHAMSPQLGQGANLALWDALTLAESLAGAEKVEEALEGYSRARGPHLRWYRFASRWLTPFFQSDYPVGWLRDLGMPLALLLPPVRRLMVRTLCGVAQGTMGLGAPVALRALPAPAAR